MYKRQVEETDYQFLGGIKGLAADWDWDLSTTYGRDKAKLYTDNNINLSNDPLRSQRRFHLTDEIFDQWTTNLDLSLIHI